MKKFKFKNHTDYIIILYTVCISLSIGKIFQQITNTNFIINCLISFISVVVLTYLTIKIYTKKYANKAQTNNYKKQRLKKILAYLFLIYLILQYCFI